MKERRNDKVYFGQSLSRAFEFKAEQRTNTTFNVLGRGFRGRRVMSSQITPAAFSLFLRYANLLWLQISITNIVLSMTIWNIFLRNRSLMQMAAHVPSHQSLCNSQSPVSAPNRLFVIQSPSFRINVTDNSLDISYEEWRDYLLFHPSAELTDIINSWRHNTVRIKSGLFAPSLAQNSYLQLQRLFPRNARYRRDADTNFLAGIFNTVQLNYHNCNSACTTH